jgi:hypothetical protein
MSFVKNLPCSHAFFKGKMINLLRNAENKELKQIMYLLQRESYDELYFCGCRSHGKGTMAKVAIFISKEKYQKHLSTKWVHPVYYHKNKP